MNLKCWHHHGGWPELDRVLWGSWYWQYSWCSPNRWLEHLSYKTTSIQGKNKVRYLQRINDLYLQIKTNVVEQCWKNITALSVSPELPSCWCGAYVPSIQADVAPFWVVFLLALLLVSKLLLLLLSEMDAPVFTELAFIEALLHLGTRIVSTYLHFICFLKPANIILTWFISIHSHRLSLVHCSLCQFCA